MPGDPDRSLHRLHYVLIDSPEEWRIHVLDLEKIIVEGLDASSLRQIARLAGVEPGTIKGVGSVKLLEAILKDSEARTKKL